MGWMPNSDKTEENPGGYVAPPDEPWYETHRALPPELIMVDIPSVNGDIHEAMRQGSMWYTRDKRAGVRTPPRWRHKSNHDHVGMTSAGCPVWMATHAETPPGYYVLSFEIDGRQTEWVDMATVQRLREAIRSLQRTGLIPDRDPSNVEADEALKSSPE